jgi:hypothetical protein
MDTLDHYKGKEIIRVVEGTGRRPTTLHYLIAAVLMAGEETWTTEQMTKMIYEINGYQPEPVDRDKAARDLGF